MVQAMMAVPGAKRTGNHRGGRRQKYVLDTIGRRLLEANYDGSTAALDRLMLIHFTKLAIPRYVVRRWAAQLGLSRQKEPRWTETEESYLQTNLYRMKLSDIAKHLGRTTVAVRIKAKHLGVNQTLEGYTMRGLMQGLGMTSHHRVQSWIEKGWLKGKRRQSERAEDFWYFSEAAIRTFIKNHPNELDPRRFDWLWVVDILAGGTSGLGAFDTKSEERKA